MANIMEILLHILFLQRNSFDFQLHPITFNFAILRKLLPNPVGNYENLNNLHYAQIQSVAN